MVLPKKPTQSKIIDVVTNAMLGRIGNGHDGLEPWGQEIIIVEQEGRRSAYLANDDKVLQPLKTQGLAAEIIKYCDSQNIPQLLVDHDLAVKIAKTYIVKALPIDKPPVVRDFDDPGFCFHRHPYNLIEIHDKELMEGACPLFANWLERVRLNREAVVHWIGSLFVGDSYNQQYLILKGSGMDGKGALLQCLADFFGPTFAVTYSDRVGAKEWTSETFGKRIIAFPDAQNLRFLNTEVFKAITGGDPVSYRFLYEQAFTAVSDAKFIICTNEDVEVTLMKSDRRRRIFAEISSGENQQNYIKDLKEEAPTFFSWCRTQYLKNCRIDAPIKVDQAVEEELEDDSVDLFDEFFSRYLTDSGSCRRSYVYDLFRNQCSKAPQDWKKFKRYLEKYYKAEEIRFDGERRIKGISVRATSHLLKK